MTTSVETTQHHIPENLPTHLQHFIDGKFVDSVGGKTFDVQEPVSNENYATVASAQPEDVDRAVAAAKRAFKEGPWSKMLPRERSRVLHKIADIVESRDDELALLESYDSGLPITQAKGQARRAAENFRFFADLIVGQEDNAFKVPGRQINYVNRKPIGVAALITPWNVPFMQESWKLAPAIATGNTVVMKPASYTPLSAVLWPEIFREAGLPDGVFNLIFGSGGVAGDYLVKHPDVPIVSFTGDSSTGATISTAAAPQFKSLSLELGGKSPAIVFADADIEAALDATVFGVFSLNGERCTAGSRVLVQRDIYDDFVARFAERAKNIKVGLPSDPTDRGRLARAPQPLRQGHELHRDRQDRGPAPGRRRPRRRLPGRATTSHPPCSPTSPPTRGSSRKKSSVPSSRSPPSTPTKRRSSSRTTPSTASPPTSGRRT
jgi:5-carboxymethyl-2-hydroxymuconic-semialdehyde dehydrogenase